LGNTAVLPQRFRLETLKSVDPRFYMGKDTIIGYTLRDESWVTPDNAYVVPLIKQVRLVSLRKTGGTQGLYRADETKPIPRITGRI
jgi:hypothetical protein